MSLQQWALPQLSELLPLEEGDLKQIISNVNGLSDADAAKELHDLLGDSPDAHQFITSFNQRRKEFNSGMSKGTSNGDHQVDAAQAAPPSSKGEYCAYTRTRICSVD